MTASFRLVVPDASGQRVLLVEEASGWALPRVMRGERWGVVSDIPVSMRERFGVEVVVLRSVVIGEGVDVSEDTDDEFRFTENVGEEAHDLAGWATEPALTQLLMTDERDRAAALRWFSERRHGAPERLEPWQREGWFAEAEAWVRSAVPGVTTVEQRSSWNGSALLRIETHDGRCYLKAAPTYFRNEGTITELLARRFSGTVPVPIVLDVERGWMVLRDFGDDDLREMGLDHWEEGLAALASMQRASVVVIDELLSHGCVDRRPSVLLHQIEATATGELGELPDGYAARLLAAMPRFEELCVELESAPIPDTLVHGDFHPGNVALKDGRYVIFDWTDACVAHPFVDLQSYFSMFGPPSTDPAVRERLLRRYLQTWADVMPQQEAAYLFHRTSALTTMHHAISYQAILSHLDPSERWQWESHLPWWIDKALEALS